MTEPLLVSSDVWASLWLLALVALPLILWALSGVSSKNKWMSPGDD